MKSSLAQFKNIGHIFKNNFSIFCRTYQHDERIQGSHSTEENVITVNDLKTLFDDETKP